MSKKNFFLWIFGIIKIYRNQNYFKRILKIVYFHQLSSTTALTIFKNVKMLPTFSNSTFSFIQNNCNLYSKKIVSPKPTVFFRSTVSSDVRVLSIFREIIIKKKTLRTRESRYNSRSIFQDKKKPYNRSSNSIEYNLHTNFTYISEFPRRKKPFASPNTHYLSHRIS